MMEVEANGKTFTFPDGTNNDQIGEAIDSYFGGESARAPEEPGEFVPPADERAPQPSPSQIFDEIKKERQDSGFFGAKYIEPALNIASSIIAEPLALASGALDSINPFTDIGDSAKVSNDVRDFLTYDPSTTDGKAGMQAIGDALNKDLIGETSIADVVIPPIKMLGEGLSRNFDFVGLNPDYGRQLGEAVPDLIGMGLATKPVTSAIKNAPDLARSAGGSAADAVTNSGISRPFTAAADDLNFGLDAIKNSEFVKRGFFQTEKKKGMALDILNKSTDNNLAGFKVNKNNNLVKDKPAREAVNAGMSEGMVQGLKAASKTDRVAAEKMTRIRKNGKENRTYQSNNRPADIAGDTFMQRYKFIAGKNKVAGRKLDNVANSLKGEKANFSEAMQGFNTNLSNLGIRMDDAGVLDFRGSIIEGLQPQKAVSQMVSRLKKAGRGGSIDAYDAHQMKKFIDEVVSGYGKNAEGLKGKTEAVFKQLRRDIDGTLDKRFPRYDAVNTQFAETRGAMDAFTDVAGKKMDLTGKNVNGAVGQLLRRLDGNAVSRTPLGDAIDLVSETAKNYGGKFEGDIRLQASYANHLDEIFGPVADTSLLGDLAKAGKRTAVESSMGRAPVGGAIDSAASVTSRLLSKSDDKSFKAIMRMLNSDY